MTDLTNRAPTAPADGQEPPVAISLIEYPSDFPIKIMGPAHDTFAAVIIDVVLQFDPEFHAGKLDQRPSSKGNFLALTANVRATSRVQLDDLYRALSSHPMVKVVL